MRTAIVSVLCLSLVFSSTGCLHFSWAGSTNPQPAYSDALGADGDDGEVDPVRVAVALGVIAIIAAIVWGAGSSSSKKRDTGSSKATSGSSGGSSYTATPPAVTGDACPQKLPPPEEGKHLLAGFISVVDLASGGSSHLAGLGVTVTNENGRSYDLKSGENGFFCRANVDPGLYAITRFVVPRTGVQLTMSYAVGFGSLDERFIDIGAAGYAVNVVTKQYDIEFFPSKNDGSMAGEWLMNHFIVGGWSRHIQAESAPSAPSYEFHPRWRECFAEHEVVQSSPSEPPVVHVYNLTTMDTRVGFALCDRNPSWVEYDIDAGQSGALHLPSGADFYMFRIADRGYSGPGYEFFDEGELEIGGGTHRLTVDCE